MKLGNHTLFHACPQKFGRPVEFSSEQYNLKRVIDEIEAQTALLSLVDPYGKQRPYAYPCNNNMVEGKEYSEVLKQKKLAAFARTGGDRT